MQELDEPEKRWYFVWLVFIEVGDGREAAIGGR